MMQNFESIYEAAVNRCDGVEAVENALPKPRSVKELKKLTDAFCLSNMSRRIFQAGLSQKIIDNKWPAFEEVFHEFDINFNRMMSDDALAALMDEKRIVRHWGKIQSVRHNAQTIYDFNEEQGGFVNTIAEWPSDNIVALWEVFKKQFKQLGGISGPYFLRRIRKDSFLLTGDVTKALFRWGAIDATPKNRKQLQHVQDCMNDWQIESGRPFCQISMILALSVD
jgi:3-methyladenine DNA glycosylase Tag